MSGETEDGGTYAGAGLSTPVCDDGIFSLLGRISTANRRLMANEDDFRIRPGKIRERGGRPRGARRIGAVRRRPTSFIGEVHQAIRRAGSNPNRLPGTGKGSGRFNARGRVAATALTLKGRSAWSRDGSGARTQAHCGSGRPMRVPIPCRRPRVTRHMAWRAPARGAGESDQSSGAAASVALPMSETPGPRPDRR